MINLAVCGTKLNRTLSFVASRLRKIINDEGGTQS